jgi:signal transduction histidine kinase
MNSIVALVWAAPRRWRYASIALLLLLTFVLGLVALLAPTTGSGVAAWWPAAATAVLALCVARRSERLPVTVLVGLTSIAGNLSGGRTLAVAAGFGVANALEAWTVTRILATGHEPARLDTVRDVLRFGIAALCGAVVLGLLAGVTVTVTETGDFASVLLTVIPSHAFAVFVIVPLALVRRRRLNPQRRIEFLVQGGIMVLVLIVAYAPVFPLPVSFLLLPLLTWAAFRFGIRVVSWELFATAVIASALTTLGAGYVGAGVSAATTGPLVQIFLLTYAASVLLLAADLAQRDDLLERERAVGDALRDLNRQKDDFVSSVSHELRTPITSILGYAEELEDTDLDADQARFTRVIVRNSHRLAQLVENLLDLSRMSTQTETHEGASVDLRALVTDCVEELALQALTKGVTLTAEFGDGHLTLHSSAADLRRMLTNLVANSVKFTPANGQVWVGCTDDPDGDGILLTVSDNGIGIPPADIERVFDRFYRSASAESLPGTGLGLPLTKGLVDRLGGSIDLQSDGHSGTHATVALPLRMPEPARAAPSVD